MPFICFTNTSLEKQFAKGVLFFFYTEFKNFNRHCFQAHETSELWNVEKQKAKKERERERVPF